MKVLLGLLIRSLLPNKAECIPLLLSSPPRPLLSPISSLLSLPHLFPSVSPLLPLPSLPLPFLPSSPFCPPVFFINIILAFFQNPARVPSSAPPSQGLTSSTCSSLWICSAVLWRSVLHIHSLIFYCCVSLHLTSSSE